MLKLDATTQGGGHVVAHVRFVETDNACHIVAQPEMPPLPEVAPHSGVRSLR